MDDLRCADRNIIHLDGRDIGKTQCITAHALHFAFTTRGGQSLVAAPHQGHLDTIIEEIEFQLDTNPDLINSVVLTKYGKPKIHRKPYFRLEFTIGLVLYFRPAGAYGDAFRSLHVQRIWVDEGAWLTERAWKALRQCLKVRRPAAHLLYAQRVAGHHLLPAHAVRAVYGVPLALLIQSQLERGTRRRIAGVLRRP